MPEPTVGLYDALLFDMDGTLLTSHAAVTRAWRAWAARNRLDENTVMAFMHGRRAVETICHFAPPGTDIAEEARWLDDVEMRDVDGITAMPGARELLHTLPPQCWAVVTSANRPLALRRIAAAGLPVPPLLVSADDVTKGKPHPEGFRLAMARLGQGSGRCLVFEDAPAGVQAGLAAGADVVMVAEHAPPDLPVKAVIQDFAQIIIRHDGAALHVGLMQPLARRTT